MANCWFITQTARDDKNPEAAPMMDITDIVSSYDTARMPTNKNLAQFKSAANRRQDSSTTSSVDSKRLLTCDKNLHCKT
jgi:hypothetical protein